MRGMKARLLSMRVGECIYPQYCDRTMWVNAIGYAQRLGLGAWSTRRKEDRLRIYRLEGDQNREEHIASYTYREAVAYLQIDPHKALEVLREAFGRGRPCSPCTQSAVDQISKYRSRS